MLFLVRHGQTEFNLARRFQGGLDSPLTSLGVAQARAMGRLLKSLIGDPAEWRMVVSPQGRAQATATLIAEECGHAGPPHLEPRIAEIRMGEWEGLSRDVIDERNAASPFPLWERQFHAPGAESYEALSARIAGWLAEVAARPHEKLIVVSHGVAGRFIRGIYGGLDREALLTQPVPQDAVFRLHAGRIDRFDAADAPA